MNVHAHCCLNAFGIVAAVATVCSYRMGDWKARQKAGGHSLPGWVAKVETAGTIAMVILGANLLALAFDFWQHNT